MMVCLYDPQSKSSRAAGAGATALSDGDTDLARVKYGEAGTILYNAARSARRAGDRHELLLLAASQYWHGGDYRRAAKVIRRIDRGFLSPRDQVILDKFHKDLAPRSTAEYALGIRMTVHNHRQAGRFEDGIDLLKEHPYVYDRTALAYIRYDLCLRAGDIEAAVYFSADANRFSAYHPDTVTGRAAAGYVLTSAGRHEQAKDFDRLVLDHEPTALDFARGSIDRYDDFKAGKREAGPQVFELMEFATAGFENLPPLTQEDRLAHDIMAHGFFVAAIVARIMYGSDRGADYLARGKRFATSNVLKTVYDRWTTSLDVEALPILSAISTEITRQREDLEKSIYSPKSIAA